MKATPVKVLRHFWANSLFSLFGYENVRVYMYYHVGGVFPALKKSCKNMGKKGSKASAPDFGPSTDMTVDAFKALSVTMVH